VGAYLGFGLAGLGLRALGQARDRDDQPPGSASSRAALAQRGQWLAEEILAVPAVSRAADMAYEFRRLVTSRAGWAVDEAHDSVEEAYGRFYLGLDRLKRAITPGGLADNEGEEDRIATFLID
jgi:hypothetical protein